MLRYAKGSHLYCDLFRFASKKERDDFVKESGSHAAISAKDAKREHKEQFAYWKSNK